MTPMLELDEKVHTGMLISPQHDQEGNKLQRQKILSFVQVGFNFIGHEGPQGGQRYSSTLFLTSALEEVEGSASRPGSTLPPGNTRYPFYRRVGGPQNRSGEVRKISPLAGFDSARVAIPTTLPDSLEFHISYL